VLTSVKQRGGGRVFDLTGARERPQGGGDGDWTREQ
jgi:hypothetical protein